MLSHELDLARHAVVMAKDNMKHMDTLHLEPFYTGSDSIYIHMITSEIQKEISKAINGLSRHQPQRLIHLIELSSDERIVLDMRVFGKWNDISAEMNFLLDRHFAVVAGLQEHKSERSSTTELINVMLIIKFDIDAYVESSEEVIEKIKEIKIFLDQLSNQINKEWNERLLPWMEELPPLNPIDR